jgi:hypothetical protein
VHGGASVINNNFLTLFVRNSDFCFFFSVHTFVRRLWSVGAAVGVGPLPTLSADPSQTKTKQKQKKTPENKNSQKDEEKTLRDALFQNRISLEEEEFRNNPAEDILADVSTFVDVTSTRHVTRDKLTFRSFVQSFRDNFATIGR